MQQFNEEALMSSLKERHVYVTKNRLAVLKVLCEQRAALTVADIIRLSTKELDRISVHRALQFFRKKGVILTIPSTKGEVRYILVGDPLSRPAINNPCVIFALCVNCGYTQLAEKTEINNINTAVDIDVRKCTIIIEGLCRKCK